MTESRTPVVFIHGLWLHPTSADATLEWLKANIGQPVSSGSVPA